MAEIKSPIFQDIVAERHIVGELLVFKERVGEIMQTLEAKMFVDLDYRLSYQVISEFFLDGNEVNYQNVQSECHLRKADFDETCLMIAIETQEMGFDKNLVPTAKVIRQHYLHRKAYWIMNQGFKSMKDGDKGAIAAMADKLLSIDIQYEDKSTTDLVKNVMEGVSKKAKGYKWGCFIDNIYGDFNLGKLVVDAASSKTGKTRKAIAIFHNLIKQKIKTHFISLELMPETIMKLLIAKESKINSRIIEHNKLDHTQFPRFSEASGIMEMQKEYYKVVSEILEPAKLYSYIKFYAQSGVEVFFIDFLTCIVCPYRDTNAFYSQIVTNLAHMAHKNNITIYLITQLRKDADDKEKPTVNMIEGTGAIKQFADVIIMGANLSYLKGEKMGAVHEMQFSIVDRHSGLYPWFKTWADLSILDFSYREEAPVIYSTQEEGGK